MSEEAPAEATKVEETEITVEDLLQPDASAAPVNKASEASAQKKTDEAILLAQNDSNEMAFSLSLMELLYAICEYKGFDAGRFGVNRTRLEDVRLSADDKKTIAASFSKFCDDMDQAKESAEFSSETVLKGVDDLAKSLGLSGKDAEAFHAKAVSVLEGADVKAIDFKGFANDLTALIDETDLTVARTKAMKNDMGPCPKIQECEGIDYGKSVPLGAIPENIFDGAITLYALDESGNLTVIEQDVSSRDFKTEMGVKAGISVSMVEFGGDKIGYYIGNDKEGYYLGQGDIDLETLAKKNEAVFEELKKSIDVDSKQLNNAMKFTPGFDSAPGVKI